MLTFYHAPMSRSGTTRWLLEELGVEFKLEIVDIRAEGGVPERYRAIQPNKKVPAIDHDGVIVTERAAIAAYLCDAFPEAGLAPPIGDPMRGPYLTWLVYVDSVVDPCFTAKGLGWTYENRGVAFGSFDDMARNLETTLSARPYAAGDRFTAADVSLATAVHWGLELNKLLPDRPVFRAYLDRCITRPAFQRVLAAG